MSLTVKAFLHEHTWRGDPKEIRRFTIDQDVSTSYAYLLEKIAQVFPSVQAGSVVVAWMDSEGDLIVISSDDELVQALDQFDGTVFRLYLKKKSSGPFSFFGGPPFVQRPATVEGEAGAKDQPQQEQQQPADGEPTTDQQPEQQGEQKQQQQQEGVLHPGVVCDGCQGPIHGTRYKCLVCSDYDLCSGCEAKGQHVDHNMVTITDPFSYNPWGFQHPWAQGFGGGHPCRGGWWGQRGHHGFHGPHGPHHGFQHPPCGGGGPWGFGGGHPRFFRGGHHGRGCGRWRGGGGPGGAPWWRYAAEGEAGKTTTGESEPMETSAESKQTGTEQQPAGSEEERRSFLHGIGQAVSNFLEPFGVKVDVDVVGGGENPPTAPPTAEGAAPTSSAAEPQPSEEVPAEFIEQSLAQLRSMGYEDEGGWLTELVKAKGGDIAKVLDALHPVTDPTIAETD